MSFRSVSESAAVGIELWLNYFPGYTVRRTVSSPLVSKPGSRLPGPRRWRGGACSLSPPLSSREGSYWLSSETEPADWLRGDRRLTWRGRDLAGLQGGCGNAAGSVRGAGRHHAARTGAVSRALGGWAAPMLHHRGNRPEPPGRPGHRQAHDPHCQGEGRGSGRSAEG